MCSHRAVSCDRLQTVTCIPLHAFVAHPVHRSLYLCLVCLCFSAQGVSLFVKRGDRTQRLKQLLRPEFVHILTREMEDEIFDSIGRLIKTLQDVAIDERHTPRLYARFLSGLLMKHRKGGSTITGRLQPHPPASELALPSLPHSHAGPRGPSGSYNAGMQAQHGSEPRHDSNAMQLKLSQLPNATEVPSSVATTAQQSYIHTVPGDGSVSGTSLENDANMEDVMGDGGTLATMFALNEVWWGNMMMPGYVFPSPATRLFGSPIL